MELERRQAVLVLPFEHRLTAGDRRGALTGLRERWKLWWHRLSQAQLQEALDNGYYFLPYVRELLFPEAAMLEPAPMEQQLRQAKELLGGALDAKEVSEKLPADAVLHLTLDLDDLSELHRLCIRTPVLSGSEEEEADCLWEFRVEWVDVVAWPQGVGFLLISVKPREQRGTLDDWRRFLDQVRLVHPPTPSWVMPSWETASGLQMDARLLVDFLLEGLAEGCPATPCRNLEEFVARCDPSGSTGYSVGRFGQVYGAEFRLFCYGVVAREEPSAEPCSDLFESPAEEALYELATGYSCATEEGRPHPRRVKGLRQRSLIALWDNWQAMVSGSRAVFLATRATEFTRHILPQNLHGQYLYLYLFTLFQKIRLSILNGEILRRGWNVARHRRESQRLWDEFFRFRNLYWYSEVTLAPQGKELFRVFQDRLDVSPLYSEMKEEVRETHRYYQGYYEQRFNRLLNVLTFVGLPAGLWVSLFGGALIGEAETQIDASWTLAAATALGLYVTILIVWFFWRRRRP